jgi:hypothetical protein
LGPSEASLGEPAASRRRAAFHQAWKSEDFAVRCRSHEEHRLPCAVLTHVLEPKLSQPFVWSFNATDTRASCLVEIVAEDGTTGWGECCGPAQLNAAVVRANGADPIGKDALATELHWQHLDNRFRDQGQKGLVVTALSGIDIALWDLKGRHFEAPNHVLMGGPSSGPWIRFKCCRGPAPWTQAARGHVTLPAPARPSTS